MLNKEAKELLRQGKQLPTGVVVENTLYLTGFKNFQLPDNMVVNGDLILFGTDVEHLPRKLTVRDSFNAGQSKLREIPDDFVVGDNVFLPMCPNLRRLPNNWKVNGNLELSGSGLLELPNNLTVLGDLILNSLMVKKLPSGLKVGKYIHLSYTKICHIPKSANVKRVLYYDEQNVGGEYSVDYYNALRKHEAIERCIFSAQRMRTLTKLIEVPELYQTDYYRNKDEILTILDKL